MMQQRRMKRLAGPAFYLNVKYDQNLMYRQMTNKDINSGDSLGLNDQVGRIAFENFDIKEGELVFSKKAVASRSTKDAYVISSLNGANDIATGTAAEKKEKIIDKYRFMGVAQTDHVAKKQFEVDQGLVTCVGGVVTIQNDYDGVIHPGEMLVVDIPDKGKIKLNRGIPRTKRRFCLRPARSSETNGVTGLYEDKYGVKTKLSALKVALDAAVLTVNALDTAANDADYQTARTAANADLLKLMVALKPRTNYVAKALSHARQGDRLDILLHPRFVA